MPRAPLPPRHRRDPTQPGRVLPVLSVLVAVGVLWLATGPLGDSTFFIGRTDATGADTTTAPEPSSAPEDETAAHVEDRGDSELDAAHDEAETPSVQPVTPIAPPPPAAPPAPGPADIPPQGNGAFSIVAGVAEPPAGGEQLLSYTVEIEEGVPLDPVDMATQVHATLNDPRGWSDGGKRAFRRVDAEPDIRVLVATPGTTDQLCLPARTGGIYSCRSGDKAVLNAVRWVAGAEAYGADVATYQQYLVSHEVGHVLGFGHVGCPEDGALAPVMMQQTKGVGSCVPNPWPFPDAPA